MKGHLKERSPGHWALVVDVRDPVTGKRKRKWHSFRGAKREAQVALAKLITERKAGTYIEADRQTAGEHLETWLTHIATQVSPATLQTYTDIVRRQLKPALGGHRLTELKAPHISAAYANALASGRRDGKGGLSARSVLHMHRILKQALKQAVDWDKLVRNPADKVKPPRVERKQMETYDLVQAAAKIEELRPTRMLIPTLLAVLCGLRRGEIVSVRWRHVDLDKAQLSISQSAEQTKAGVRYKEPKSNRARTVALSATMVTELRAHRAAQAQELLRVGMGLSADTFVVAQADGSPLQPRSLTHEWIRLRAKSALPRVRLHDLRHSHASHMLGAGVHPKIASERLGHSKVGITLDLYSHVLPGMQEDAAARVDEALRAAVQKRRSEGIG